MYEQLIMDSGTRSSNWNLSKTVCLSAIGLCLGLALIVTAVIVVCSVSTGATKGDCGCRNNGTCSSIPGLPCNCTMDYMGHNCTYNKYDVCQSVASGSLDYRGGILNGTCYFLYAYDSYGQQRNWSGAVSACAQRKRGLLFRPQSQTIMTHLFDEFGLPMHITEYVRVWTGLILVNRIWYLVDDTGYPNKTASEVPWENDGWSDDYVSVVDNATEYGIANFHMDDELKPGGSIETMMNGHITLPFICQYDMHDIIANMTN